MHGVTLTLATKLEVILMQLCCHSLASKLNEKKKQKSEDKDKSLHKKYLTFIGTLNISFERFVISVRSGRFL